MIASFVAACLIAMGYWRGYSSQHDALVSLKAEIATQAATQAEQVKKKEEENDKNTFYVAQVYSSDSMRLGAMLGRLRNLPSGSGASAVRSAPVHTGIAGASSVQPAGVIQGACNSTGSDPCSVQRAVYEGAIKDAQAWEAVQWWLVREGMPIKLE